MKVLWIVNSIFPYPAKQLGQDKTCFGGWLTSMHEQIINNEDLELAIATTYIGKDFKKFEDTRTKYYLIPTTNSSKYKESVQRYWKMIVEEFNPEIVHIHGTEYPRGLEFIDSGFNIPSVISIQGLVTNVADVYYGNISTSELIKNISFRDIVKLNTIFDCKRDFARRGKYEHAMIKKCDHIIGRTLWDKSNILSISPNKSYFHLNEMLRDPFYTENKWNIDRINKYSLFCSQASYPIKGLHILLKSISILKQEYPEVKLYISGSNIVDESTFKNKIKTTGYAKYIKKLIKEYDVKDNIVFTGFLNAEQVKDQLLKTHVYVSPSFIENESNSLSEASLLGVPAVGSFVGGVTERIRHGVTGYHYPATDPAMLAHYIKKIFDDNDLANKMSANAKDFMAKIVDRKVNAEKLFEIYNNILQSK